MHYTAFSLFSLLLKQFQKYAQKLVQLKHFNLLRVLSREKLWGIECIRNNKADSETVFAASLISDINITKQDKMTPLEGMLAALLWYYLINQSQKF